jgi:hypothetical protein
MLHLKINTIFDIENKINLFINTTIKMAKRIFNVMAKPSKHASQGHSPWRTGC